MCDVALRVCDVALPVFDREQSVLRTRVRNSQLCIQDIEKQYLEYRLDLYLDSCLWYWSNDHGTFKNTPVFMVT